MKFDADGYLLAIDTYSGLYRINVATGQLKFYTNTRTLQTNASIKYLWIHQVFLETNDVV